MPDRDTVLLPEQEPSRIPIVIRPLAPSEKRLVQASWARSLFHLPTCDGFGRRSRNGSPLYISLGHDASLLTRRSLLIRAHSFLVDDILASPDTRVAVAILPEIDEPMGWVCWEGGQLHFVFVRDDCRRARVATRLVQHTGCSSATHVTPLGRALVKYLRGDVPR